MSVHVSGRQGASKTLIGMDADPSSPLNKAIRAHGNAAEYVPLLIVLFLYFNTVGAGAWVEWTVVALTLCRVLHAAGMLMSADLNRPHPLRIIGALGTYLGGFALGIALLLSTAS
ncbi:MAG: MAPEG family protein [Methylocaldum sp.]|nr:MAPEG family protein [Methylocaldum sp.]